MRVTVYKNSIAATLVSAAATIIALLGVIMLFTGAIVPGAIAVVLGAGGLFLARFWSEKKLDRQWIENAKQSGLENQIRASQDAAVRAYISRQTKGVLEYITSVNPQAGTAIAGAAAKFRAQKKRK